MNLDEAIRHAKEVAEMNRKEAEELREYGEHVSSPKQPYNLSVKACLECANEHEQLAGWLTDYKRLLEWEKDIKHKVYRNEHCDRKGKCIDYIDYRCDGCNGDVRGER